MARLSTASIEQVKARADVYDVVSQVVQLRQRGRNFFGLCPFHEEKTASFSVNPGLGIYHCFGCGKGGNAINFVMEYEKVDYIEAVKRLAERYGVILQWEGQQESTKDDIAILYDLHLLARDFYRRCLFSEKGQEARRYLSGRGFGDTVLQQFDIGFAPDEWDALTRQLDPKIYKPEILEKSGLCIRRENDRFLDRFRNRIMFPIINITGRVVAFGGRSMDPREEAKYLNSPETPIYYKSGTLYGLNYSRDFIRRKEETLLVEGYTDFLRLFTAGIQNVVAGSGTALNSVHAGVIKRLTSRVVLCYDGDEAGQKASERAGLILLKEGLDVEVMRLPAEHDPDSLLVQGGTAAFELLRKQALTFIDYYLQNHQPELNTPASKTAFIEQLIPEIAEIRHPITRDYIIKQIAERLNTRPELIISQLSRFYKNRQERSPKPASVNQTPVIELNHAADRAEFEIIKTLLTGSVEVQAIINEKNLSADDFNHPVLKQLAIQLIHPGQQSTAWQPGNLFDYEWSETERFYLGRLIVEAEEIKEYAKEGDLKKLVVDCIDTLYVHQIDIQIRQARDALKKAEAQGLECQEQVWQLAELQALRRSIKAKTGTSS